MAGETFRVGDRVRWKSGGAAAEGRVVEVATERGHVGDFASDASADSPRYSVEADEGKRAARRAGALSRLRPGRA